MLEAYSVLENWSQEDKENAKFFQKLDHKKVDVYFAWDKTPDALEIKYHNILKRIAKDLLDESTLVGVFKKLFADMAFSRISRYDVFGDIPVIPQHFKQDADSSKFDTDVLVWTWKKAVEYQPPLATQIRTRTQGNLNIPWVSMMCAMSISPWIFHDFDNIISHLCRDKIKMLVSHSLIYLVLAIFKDQVIKGQWFDHIFDLECLDSVKAFSDTSNIAASLKMAEELEDTIINGDGPDSESETGESED